MQNMLQVVWNAAASDGANSLRVWMTAIKQRLPIWTPQSTVSILVVATHIDDPSVTQYEVSARREQVNEIAREVGLTHPLTVLEVSNKTQQGLAEFEETLVETCLLQPHMGEQVPDSFFVIEDIMKSVRSSVYHRSEWDGLINRVRIF